MFVMLCLSSPSKPCSSFAIGVSFSHKNICEILPQKHVNVQLRRQKSPHRSNSFADILYWGTFERLQLDPENLELFKGSIVDFSIYKFMLRKNNLNTQEINMEILNRRKNHGRCQMTTRE